MRTPRKAVRWSAEAEELLEKARESIKASCGGYCPPEAHILENCLKIGMIQVAESGATGDRLLPPVTDGSKKEPKKNNIQTDRSREDFSKQIEQLKQQIGNHNLVEDVLVALASTRKTGRMAPSVVAGFLSWCAGQPVKAVVMGMERYLDRDFAAKGKRENYLEGIIRGCVREVDGTAPGTVTGGNDGETPPPRFLPKGYPNVYDGRKFKWSEPAQGWYPKDRFGKAETTGGSWKWIEGMKKGE